MQIGLLKMQKRLELNLMIICNIYYILKTNIFFHSFPNVKKEAKKEIESQEAEYFKIQEELEQLLKKPIKAQSIIFWKNF